MVTRRLVELADAERIGAMIDGAPARLAVVFSDDLLWIHASGVVDTKQSMLDQFASGVMRCFAIDRSDVVIRIFDDVAVMTGVIEMDAQARGTRRTARSRFTGVWRAEAPGLRLISWQSGRLPETSAAEHAVIDGSAAVADRQEI